VQNLFEIPAQVLQHVGVFFSGSGIPQPIHENRTVVLFNFLSGNFRGTGNQFAQRAVCVNIVGHEQVLLVTMKSNQRPGCPTVLKKLIESVERENLQ
jgi:hypothetical protein